ncbi:MAG: PQQ-binding-like beta-propeller repeat protein [Rikenellaceae bacterium]
MKQNKFLVALLATSTILSASAKSVPTQNNSIRYTAVANVAGAEMLYISEERGIVSLNGLDGSQAWRIECDDPAVMFELLAVDIDADGSDDVVAVSGNGSVYAINSTGKMMWKYSTPEISRLSEVAAIGKGESLRIFAGGNDFKLYELNANGELIAISPIEGCVRSLASGRFTSADREVLYLHTYAHDKFNSHFFGLIDPDTKEVIVESDIKKLIGNSQMVNDMEVSDVNGDGLDDILIFASFNSGTTLALDGNLKTIFKYTGFKDLQRYAAAKGASLLPERQEIAMQFGGMIYLISPTGELISRTGEPHKGIIYNDILWLPKSQQIVGAGRTGGDNTLYFYDATKNSWPTQSQKLDGLALEVKENVETLYQQSLDFKMPKYQSKSEKPFVVIGLKKGALAKEVAALDGGEIIMVYEVEGFGENTPRTEMVEAFGKSAEKRDRRKTYDDSSDEIVAWAAEREKQGTPFQLWVGHGTDPFIIQIATLERIIAAAPTTCFGFIYAEMHDSTDPSIQHFITEYMPRLAAAIRNNKANTKLYFRYKNMFWAADAHEPLWKTIFLSGDYHDVVVPSAEDTNNRLQDLNFAGRVGMFMSGAIDNFAMRLVDDNPTSWRPLSQGGQRSISQYLRNGVLTAAYGSSHGVLFPSKYFEAPGYNALFALIASGVVPMIEDPRDILSVGSWHLVKDVDQEYVAQTNDTGHNLLTHTIDDDKAVIGKAGVQWCGSTITPYDFSRVSLGLEYRWLNFMPPMPYGMVPIAASEYAPQLDKEGVDYVTSDIKSGYINGVKSDDYERFGEIMTSTVEAGAEKMLMRVDGASWALIRVGEKQARLIVIDNGYVSPSKKVATVSLQNMTPTSVTDILTGEKIKVSNTIEIEVPAGSMRFIDFEYSKKI